MKRALACESCAGCHLLFYFLFYLILLRSQLHDKLPNRCVCLSLLCLCKIPMASLLFLFDLTSHVVDVAAEVLLQLAPPQLHATMSLLFVPPCSLHATFSSSPYTPSQPTGACGLLRQFNLYGKSACRCFPQISASLCVMVLAVFTAQQIYP